MAHDLLLGKTSRDWSCGKSAAELWDEAESQRLHKPVRQMRGKSAAELWDEAESQRLHYPVHWIAPNKKRGARQAGPGDLGRSPDALSLSALLTPILAGIAATLGIVLYLGKKKT